ncbi:uncharacterized protein PHACADRAFT_193971 [Phanerochaete carnosa HHB-10118-sp]|uniref:Uncharacterized protein n=1 Tax=Phanerochaete carnosa (strain HHB-10118-sp) TaxID=650164 RepID=K5WBL5_PHACS|nr:uncharacterized protein PHACADRAFT_193971 [Phanerochaete carnosa HHB-10118-sp]EKM56354.1 hypothetical protein PHACADRAFT_193971 [Phanerochaete carnosa HHB-10118-sp]
MRELKGRLLSTHSMKPSDNLALMEQLSGIAAKVSSLTNKCQKALDAPAHPPMGLQGSLHASARTALEQNRGKKCPAIFLSDPPAPSELPAKRQATDGESQRVQDPHAILRDWKWGKIAAIGPLMDACKGCMPPESALALTKIFEFRPRKSGPPPGVPTPATYAATTSGQLQTGGTQPPSARPPTPAPTKAASAQPKPKLKALVVHVAASWELTKILQVVFSTVVTNLAHRREEGDVCIWVCDWLQHIGEEPNEVIGLNWHNGGVHVDIRFQSRLTVAMHDSLNKGADWFANTTGVTCAATVNFYMPITRITVKALRTHHKVTNQELPIEAIVSAIAQENPWIADRLLHHIQSPKPFWMDSRGGSGMFVFAAYDNCDGMISEGWCKRRLCVFGVNHNIQHHDIALWVSLCNQCWHWEHTGGACRANKLFCSRCSLPHIDVDHSRFCIHPQCQQACLSTMEAQTFCEHVYCASCDSVEHALSSQECSYSCHAGDRDAKKWFSKNPAQFSAQDMRQRGKEYDGEVAVGAERQCRQALVAVEGAPELDDVMPS